MLGSTWWTCTCTYSREDVVHGHTITKLAHQWKKYQGNKQQMEEWRTESFAVVKCSSSPHKYFRDAMVELNMENGINHQEDLKEVLFCYLRLLTPTNIMT